MAMMTRISLVLAATFALSACPRPQEPKDPTDPGPADDGETGTDQQTDEPSAETKPA